MCPTEAAALLWEPCGLKTTMRFPRARLSVALAVIRHIFSKWGTTVKMVLYVHVVKTVSVTMGK